MSVGHDFDALLNRFLSEARSDVENSDELQRVLSEVTDSAVTLIQGVDCADILTIADDGFGSTAPTAKLAVHIDDLQQRFGQGPCVEAAQHGGVVRCNDLRDEPRFPQFAAAAVELGVLSMMSFQLYTDHGSSGALNLLSFRTGALSSEAEALGASLAAHAALAIATLTRHQQFESGLASRDIIGQAKGVIMERYSIDALAAFTLLRRLSQGTNTVLREVAERLIASLDTPAQG